MASSGYQTSEMPTVQAEGGFFGHVFARCKVADIKETYDVEKKAVGEGSYGSVYKGKHKDTKAERALKRIDVKKLGKDGIEKFEKEMHIQESLDHPNIVKLYETFRDDKAGCVYLVMEMCTGGELFDRIIDEVESHDGASAFDEKQAATYVSQIVGAMRYMQSHNIVHRDIKPENFLMENKTKEAQIKVIDFGLAAKMEPGQVLKTKAGTPYYVAPEVLAGRYDEKCDVWSCGVITYILLCGYPTFYGDSDAEILGNVKKGKYDYPSPDWDNVSKSGKQFIDLMLQMKPKDRPSFAELAENPWLRDHADKGSGKLNSNLGGSLKKFRDSSKFKKLALTVLAQQLSDDAIKELKETFKVLDANGDGTLTIDEIKDGMKKNNLDIDMSVINALDTDGSGQIDYSEFVAAALDHSKHLTEPAMMAAFRVFDADNSGKISVAELKQILGGDGDIAAMIKEVDIDGDGEISFDEFKKAMQKA